MVCEGDVLVGRGGGGGGVVVDDGGFWGGFVAVGDGFPGPHADLQERDLD